MARDLREFIKEIEALEERHVIHVDEPINPADFDVTALLFNLEAQKKNPMLIVNRPLNLFGEVSEFPLITNIYGSRKRCAHALGLPMSEWRLPLSLHYAELDKRRIPPVVISKAEAPVKEVVRNGDDADLRILPLVRHHELDPAPYIDMVPVMKVPGTNAYNAAFLRCMYKGPRKLGIHMSPRHNWQIVRKNEEQGLPTPVAIVVSHHPAFFLGSTNVAPYGEDDYAVIGSFMNEAMRLVPSETLGDDFLVPADADLIIEGFIPPNVREVEGPFGEFPRTYGPQRLRWIIEVTSITHRKNAYHQDAFVGHRDDWTLGGIPKEGALYNRIKGVVPTVKAVHLPDSGCCRFNCYISIDKKVNGESKQAALLALGEIDFIKNVIVVDGDVDPFDEQQVMWAVATRTQADEDVDIIKNVKGNTLDPSQRDDIMTAKLIIDATKPIGPLFPEVIDVPASAKERANPEKWVRAGELQELSYND